MPQKKSEKPVEGMKKSDLVLVKNIVSNSVTGNENTAANSEGVNILPLSQIKLPDSQPRKYFDPTKLDNLAQSISEHGVLEPLLVRAITQTNDFELIAGERRYKAAGIAKLKEVPVVVLEVDDDTANQIRLVENLQREDLNPLEETEAIFNLLCLKLKLEEAEVKSLLYKMHRIVKDGREDEIAQNVLGSDDATIIKEIFNQLGKISWQSFTSSRLPLLKLPLDILEVLRAGEIEYTKAKAIAKVKDEQQRRGLLETAVAENLSLSEIKEKVKEANIVDTTPIKTVTSSSLKNQIKTISTKLKTSSNLDDTKQGKLQKLLEKFDKDLDKLLGE